MRPLIIAHRGHSAKFTENTLEAFKAAIEYHCDMIELDVHLSSDDELIVHHDHKLKRIARRKGRVNDYTVEELRSFNVPSLRDVFSLVNKRVPINIEIKHDTIRRTEFRALMVKKLILLLKETGMNEHVLISSFDDAFLKELRKRDQNIRLGVLDHGRPGQRLKISLIKELRAYSYHPSKRTLRLKQMHQLHEAGVKVFAYTANDIKSFQKLCTLKVDGIITNEVELLYHYLQDPRDRDFHSVSW